MKTIGINLPSSCSKPAALDDALHRFSDDGFDVVEICLDTMPLIVGGERQDAYVDWLKERIAGFPLKYSGHIGRNVDLRSVDNYELQKKVALASIDICSILGLSPLVLHFELVTRNDAIEARFRDDHHELAQYAQRAGVALCIENIEVERVEPVASLVREINHPNLRMCIDVGHAYLAAGYFEFDYLSTIESVVDIVGHVHMSDNTGVFEPLRITDRPSYDSLPMTYRIAFGRGDIHIPPLWGRLPYREIGDLLRPLDCIFLCEYYSDHYLPFNASVQRDMRKLLEG